MQGLAFAVALFNRLSAERPTQTAGDVVTAVEGFVNRLVEVGKTVEPGFAAQKSAAPTLPPSPVSLVGGPAVGLRPAAPPLNPGLVGADPAL